MDLNESRYIGRWNINDKWNKILQMQTREHKQMHNIIYLKHMMHANAAFKLAKSKDRPLVIHSAVQ